MSTNITGVIVTSRSCSGTCLTLSIPRQPKASAAETAFARGGLGVEESALRSASASADCVARPAVVGGVLMGLLLLDRRLLRDRLLLGGVARERQEDLVEARLA